MKKRLVTLLTVLILLPLLPVAPAQAMDLNQRCALNIELSHDGTPITGVFVDIYRIAQTESAPGGYAFFITGEYAGSGADLSQITDVASNLALAADLMTSIKANGLSGTHAVTDSTGIAYFKNLPAGLYLVSIGEAEGYMDIAPYLISIPQSGSGGEVLYDVTAQPKTEPAPVSLSPSTLVSPSPIPDPGSGGEKLPQTGVLEWPIPVMGASGLILIVAGLLLQKNHRKREKP